MVKANTQRPVAARSAAEDATPFTGRSQRRLVATVAGVVLVLGVTVLAFWLAVDEPEKPGAVSPTAQVPQVPHHATDAAPWPPIRPFKARSWWNTPIPRTAPENPATSEILNYLRTAPGSGGGCLALAGAGSNQWGQPIYWARPSDPSYNIDGVPVGRPPELDALHIPVGARAAHNDDGTMAVFDLDKGYVTLLTDAAYDGNNDAWSASGATVTYLRSNGLHVMTKRADDPRNSGTHRGNNGATSAVRWDMVKAGVINNVLKVALGPEAANRWVFPMVGSDGDYEGNDPAVPPEGLRLRIKPSVDLETLGLHPQALVIARALQRYGAYIGDSGGVTALKLEDTVTEGRGQLWDLTTEDLCGLPFTPTYWDVLPEGYDPSHGR